MGGMSWIHAGFLGATLAASVPVLIHLLYRQRARKVNLGSLRFLRVVLKDRAHRRRLRRWLLLALRVASMLLLAFMFARPYLRDRGALGSESEVVVLVDRSASMGARNSNSSAFGRAQEAAQRILRETPAGSAVQLAYFDTLATSVAEPKAMAGEQEVGFARGDLGQALGWARDVFSRSSRSQRTLYLLTDMQRSGLPTQPPRGFPRDVNVQVVDVGQPITRNLAIESVQVRGADLRPDVPVVIRARVANLGPFDARDVTVRLSLSGKDAPRELSQVVSVASMGQQVVEFSLDSLPAGIHEGYVELGDEDPLACDNRRWLAFQARPASVVLLVDGAPAGSVYSQETYYLEAALRLRITDLGPARTAYEPRRLEGREGWQLPDLDEVNVVVLVNVASIEAAVVAELADFVSRGGNLLVFGGDQVSHVGYAALREAGILPAQCRGPSDTATYRVATWDRRHAMLKVLSDAQHGDLRSVTFRRLTLWEPAQGGKVLASDQQEHALLIEGRLGKGSVLVFAPCADRDWGDWTTHRLFLPLVHQTLAYLTQRLPENAVVQTRSLAKGVNARPGITRREGRLTVRNIDPRESKLERMTLAEFRRGLKLSRVNASPHAAADASNWQPPASVERPNELWRYLAWGLLVVLVGETFLANRTHA